MHRSTISLVGFLALSVSLFGQSPTVPSQSYLRNNSFVNWESPHVHPLDITSSGQLLAVNTPNNSLEVYNANGATLTFVKSIPVGLDPVTVRSFPNNSNQAWVVNVISDSVSIVDLAHGIVTQTLQVNDEPADVVFAGPSASLAVVSCAQAKMVLVFNASNPTVPTAVIRVIGLVAKGGVLSSTVRPGYMYLGNGVWQSDHLAEVDTTAAINALVANGATLTFTAVPNESAARIGIDMDGDGILDSDDAQPALANVAPVDLALTGTATAASVYDANHTAAKAIDGNTIGYFDQNSMLHTQGGTNDWFQEDLGGNAQINLVQLFNRWDCCANRLSNVSVFISQVPFASTGLTQTRAQLGVKEYFLSGNQGALAQIPMQTAGRYIRVQLNDAAAPVPLQLAEVRIMGYEIASFPVPATQTVAAGHSVNLTRALNNPTPNASYTYSALNLPPGLSINPATGAISGSVSSTAASSYTTTVTALGTTGAGSPSVSFDWIITGSTPPFTLAAPPLTLEAGTGGTTPVTVTPAAGFSGSVSLSLAGLPSGASSTFLANSATSFILVIYVPPTVTPGTYPLTITGKSGSIVETTTLNLVITPLVSASQTITFGPIAAQIVGASLTVSATASSGLPVSFTLVQNGNCSISGNAVKFLNVGDCGVIANQAGNSAYSPAPAVGQVIVVNQ